MITVPWLKEKSEFQDINIFIGTNNHYAVVYPLNDKKASTIHNSLSRFIN